ncbi:MAG: dipeptidase [Dehalococcoidia bacterium]|nr:dipeptidase [Dehalococcoidia bacterium]
MAGIPADTVFDGHNDTLVDIRFPKPEEERSFLERSEHGHLDLPRAVEGGFGGGFFAVCVPADPTSRDPAEFDLLLTETGYELPLPPPLDPAYAHQMTVSVMASAFRLEAESGGKVKVARSAREVASCLRRGVIAIVLHLEGADAIDPELEALHIFYQSGLRSLGIVWSRPNAFGTGVPFKFPGSPDTGPGLSERGKELVRECNRLGVVVDLAHLNEQGFWDVAALSDQPLVVTHAAAHALCPSSRNLTDRQIDAIGESGGVIGVAFHVGFLRADGRPDAETPITEIVRHVDYIAGRIGVEHVAFGSDFDGAVMPLELGDVTGLPKLIEALRARGYDEAALRKATHENWLRLLKRTWKS